MKKILFTAKEASHIIHFHLPYLKFFKDSGYQVHVACEDSKSVVNADVVHEIKFGRNPFSIRNVYNVRVVGKLIKEQEYDIIHCHTPVASVVTRLAVVGKKRKSMSVIYTAHGFHFFKGAPLFNRILYYGMEKFLSIFTDCIITINDEDFDAAREGGFKAGSIYKVDGVGIQRERFLNCIRDEGLRNELGIEVDDFFVVCVAELSYRKHQDMLLDMASVAIDRIKGLKLILVGNGEYKGKYIDYSRRKGLEDAVVFAGYRKDIPQIMAISDVAVSSSRHEGLPVNIMEAMASGLPLIVTDCRGNRDLVENGSNGFVVDIDDVEGFVERLEMLYKDDNLRKNMALKNIVKSEKYDISLVFKQMKNIYEEYM